MHNNNHLQVAVEISSKEDCCSPPPTGAYPAHRLHQHVQGIDFIIDFVGLTEVGESILELVDEFDEVGIHVGS